MTAQHVVRAWKDVQFRDSRGSDNMPANPVGVLDFEELSKLVDEDDDACKSCGTESGCDENCCCSACKCSLENC